MALSTSPLSSSYNIRPIAVRTFDSFRLQPLTCFALTYESSGLRWWRARARLGLEAAAITPHYATRLRSGEWRHRRRRRSAPADLKSLDSIVSLANRLQPDLTVVGPELPLTLGVVDEFTRRGWPIFGPTQSASRLELSKSFAKEFLQRHHIPTAHFAICDSMDQVRSALGHFHSPVVVKADGLAAGKGVVIAKSKEEAASVAAEMLSGRMLGMPARVSCSKSVSREMNFHFCVFSDGERVAPLVAAQDHKRVGDGDTGPNTGGMGAYSTARNSG